MASFNLLQHGSPIASPTLAHSTPKNHQPRPQTTILEDDSSWAYTIQIPDGAPTRGSFLPAVTRSHLLSPKLQGSLWYIQFSAQSWGAAFSDVTENSVAFTDSSGSQGNSIRFGWRFLLNSRTASGHAVGNVWNCTRVRNLISWISPAGLVRDDALTGLG